MMEISSTLLCVCVCVCVCGVKTGGKCGNMHFTGLRIEASVFLIPLVHFTPIVSHVTCVLCMCTKTCIIQLIAYNLSVLMLTYPVHSAYKWFLSSYIQSIEPVNGFCVHTSSPKSL